MNKTQRTNWLLFSYDVPDKPSRIKVGLWRRLKHLGAIYPQMSFCILPDSKALRSQLTNLRSQVQSYGPSLTLQIKGVSNSDSKKLFQLYKDDVDREYRELLEECKEFLDEIKNNLASGNVTQTEVSELEESLEGLERWFAKIKGRDSGRSQIRANIERVMRRCHSALLRFSEKAQPQTRLPGIHRLQRRLKTPR